MAFHKNDQDLIKDLNLGGSTNLVCFTRVTNVVSDQDMQLGVLGMHCKCPQWGLRVNSLEANV